MLMVGGSFGNGEKKQCEAGEKRRWRVRWLLTLPGVLVGLGACALLRPPAAMVAGRSSALRGAFARTGPSRSAPAWACLCTEPVRSISVENTIICYEKMSCRRMLNMR